MFPVPRRPLSADFFFCKNGEKGEFNKAAEGASKKIFSPLASHKKNFPEDRPLATMLKI